MSENNLQSSDKYIVKDGKLYDNSGAELKFIRAKAFKREDANGKKFTAYKAICSNKRYLDLSFTLDCGNPEVQGDIVIITSDYSVDTNRMYPRIYVKSKFDVIPFVKELKDTLQYVKSCD